MREMGFPLEYLVATCLLGVHYASVTRPGHIAKYASSNLVTNLIRLEQLDSIEGSFTVVAGSSMTGRLNEDAISATSGLNVLNLGLDGCAALDGLTQVELRGLNPGVVVIEANSICLNSLSNSSSLHAASSGAMASVRKRLPSLRFRERPVDLFYSLLRSQTIDSLHTSSTQDLEMPHTLPSPQNATPISDAVIQRLTPFSSCLTKLKNSGSKITLVMLPDNGANREQEYGAVYWIQQKTGANFLDLKKKYDNAMTYTDSVHLNGDSSLRISRLLGRWINQSGPRK